MTAADPWYRTTLRWAQTNLTEIDPQRYDDAWWRKHWHDTAVQGAIINAGGIVAYYPSKFELHHRAVALGDRDLYGEIVASARDEGLAVVARMDSNRVDEAFYRAHPEWICRDIDGQPITVADKWVTCINSPTTGSTFPTSSGRSSNAATRMGSPTTVGQASPANRSATAVIAPSSSALPPDSSSLMITIGMRHSIGPGSGGATSGVPTCGISTTGSPPKPAAPTASGSG
ncbi:hypothetical protein GCM10027613_21410 [Microlunatus endophyticus]